MPALHRAAGLESRIDGLNRQVEEVRRRTAPPATEGRDQTLDGAMALVEDNLGRDAARTAADLAGLAQELVVQASHSAALDPVRVAELLRDPFADE